jgi:hypothetical protein
VAEVVHVQDGELILLANVPNAGVAVQRKTGSQGGNDAHDARSGKFAPKPGDPPSQEGATPNIDPIELKRMMDAVRDAAREFDFPEEGDIREFLAGRAKNPGQVDIAAFLQLVQEQIKTDITDILDNQLRAGGVLKRGRRTVRLSAPRGYINKTLRGLDEDSIAEIMHRLESRGHDPEDIDRFFSSKVKIAEGAKKKKEAIAASEDWGPDPYIVWTATNEDVASEQYEFAADLVEKMATSLKPPVVNVHVDASPRPMKVTPVRDESGLITHTISEPADG